MKERVAIYLSGVHNLKGGGGVERFFADFFDIYSEFEQAKFDLYFFTDESTFKALKEVNKLHINNNRIILLKNVSNRFKKSIENFDFKRKVKKYKIDIIHCANYGRQDFDRLSYLSKLKEKPFLVLNIVDCQVPYILQNKHHEKYHGYSERYVIQPNKIQFDGVFSWYKLFIEYINESNVFNFNPIMYAISSRFANTSHFKPNENKENIIVFASRLDEQKKPNWFILAIELLVQQKNTNLDNWSFHMYGEGPLENEMIKMVNEKGLCNYVKFCKSGDLSKVLPSTTIYVSTQDFENFPSLSMMEAMACGNIILARNVGQTDLMVRDGYNGYLLEEDSPIGLANALSKVISISDTQRKNMMKESLKMISDVHTPKNFINQIENFWFDLKINN